VTPYFTARLNWVDEEFYAARRPDRPLVELEVRPMPLPATISLLGAPSYDKGVMDLGFAASLGLRPWNYARVALLWPDYYYNKKHDADSSYYRRDPHQITVEGAWRWAERYKARLLWQDNRPQEFVLDNQFSVFSYRSQSYRASLDRQWDDGRTAGIALTGFDTRQSRSDSGVGRSQSIRYDSVNAYWIRRYSGGREWTWGIRYDDFRNRERAPVDPATEFDYLFTTWQGYGIFYRPYAEDQALNLGLYLGDVRERQRYIDTTIAGQRDRYFEAKLLTAWELFSVDPSSAFSVGLSWNLDDLVGDTFDGGSLRFRTEF